MELYLMPLLGGISAYLLIFALFSTDSDSKIIKKRLSKIAVKKDFDTVHDEVMREKRAAKEKKKRTLISKQFENYLTQTGVKISAKEFLIAWLCTTIIPIFLLLVLGANIITVIGAGTVGFVIPPIIVQNAKKKRQQLFAKQLSQALVMIGNSIKSGYSFLQAMESISEEMQPPISSEFSHVLREIHYGVKMEDALNHMVERTQSTDLALLVSAVVTSSQVGANLSDILDNISATIGDRIQIKNEIRVLTAQGRISGLIIGLLPVIICLLFMLVNPGYIMSFFDSNIGKILLGAGVVLEIIGFFAVRKIVDLKY